MTIDRARAEDHARTLAGDGSASPLLAVDSLRVVLAGSATDVVDEVSFTLDAGEVLGLVGESGSGKTTVALALMGYARRGLAIDGGTVTLDGVNVLGLDQAALRRLRGSTVAYVAQDPTSALNPALKVRTQLREVLAAHRPDLSDEQVDARIAELLAEVRLDGVAAALDSFPHQLSGGQQQRVMLAIAFACRPRLIVLDEPTTGLDVTTQRHVLDSIRGLCRIYHVAAVYVSHDLAVIADIADRIGVMYAGRLVELGPTERAFRAPGHPYTRGLLRAIPDPARAHVLEGLEGQPPRPGSRPEGCSFAARCEFAIAECRIGSPPIAALADGGHWARCRRAAEVAQLPPLGELPLRERAAGAADQALLTVENLSAQYGERQVLAGVSFSVAPRRCLAIVGESGAGKTTLARCIVGLHAQWQGSMTFDGAALRGDRRGRDRATIRALQYVFQNPYTSLNPRKTVGQLVEQPLRQLFKLPASERQARVVGALRDAALSEAYLPRYPDQLSGGERQRVAIARSLVVEPKLLVCDEVTSALDVSVQAAIVELLHRLKLERELTIVLITHNLALVRSLADDVVILRDGEVIEQGPEVLDHPRAPYTHQLLSDVPSLSLA
ncbi:MAG TPA: ABC transporter ATP-binding protein [Solirubrobacteraceae bacterium]|nr:ABC transporter ATP-binding protein [Solirubrobacteraceae bacterium]